MRKLLASICLAWSAAALLAQTPVQFPIRDMTGSDLSRLITVTPLDPPIIYNSVEYNGGPFDLQPVPNGATNSLGQRVNGAWTNVIGGNFRITIQGLPAATYLFVPFGFTNGIVATDPLYIRRGIVQIFVITNQAGLFAIAGTNMVAVTNGAFITLSLATTPVFDGTGLTGVALLAANNHLTGNNLFSGNQTFTGNNAFAGNQFIAGNTTNTGNLDVGGQFVAEEQALFERSIDLRGILYGDVAGTSNSLLSANALVASDAVKNPVSVVIGNGITYNTSTHTLSADGGAPVNVFITTNLYTTNLYASNIVVTNITVTTVYASTNFSTNLYSTVLYTTNITVYDSVTINTNLTVNQNFSVSGKATLNNITATNQLQFTTNAFPLAPGTTWDLSKPKQFITTNADFNVSAIGGLTNYLYNWGTLEISNSGASTIICHLTIPALHPFGPLTTNNLYIGSGKEGEVSIETRGVLRTNYVTTVEP